MSYPGILTPSQYEYDGASESVEYDADGNVAARVDAQGRRTEYTYDAANRLRQSRFPDGTLTSATYTWRGQPLTQTDQAGQSTMRSETSPRSRTATAEPGSWPTTGRAT